MKTFEGYMNGVNLGGWLSQCEPSYAHYDSFITEEDISRIASWGLDHVRVPIDYLLVETEEGDEVSRGYSYIDNAIKWCRKYGLNMILDLHRTCGYTFDDQEYSRSFFDNEQLKNRFVSLWQKLARRYSKDKDMLCLELLNEIVDPNVAEKWNELALRAINAIREIDSDIRIIYGGIGYNSITAIPLLQKPNTKNIIFTFHCYEPLIFTHQGAHWTEGMPVSYRTSYPNTVEYYLTETRTHLNQLMLTNLGNASDENNTYDTSFFESLFKEAVGICENFDIPLYCGEYGVIDRAEPISALRWYKDITSAFNNMNIGRAAWTYKQMDFGIIDEHLNSVYEDITKLL